MIECDWCDGTGLTPGTQNQCPNCDGNGMVVPDADDLTREPTAQVTCHARVRRDRRQGNYKGEVGRPDLRKAPPRGRAGPPCATSRGCEEWEWKPRLTIRLKGSV
jgi:hypothetical protein